jgi:hypothetical protein
VFVCVSALPIVPLEPSVNYEVAQWFRHSDTSHKDSAAMTSLTVAIYLILPAAHGPGVYSTSNRNYVTETEI